MKADSAATFPLGAKKSHVKEKPTSKAVQTRPRTSTLPSSTAPPHRGQTRRSSFTTTSGCENFSLPASFAPRSYWGYWRRCGPTRTGITRKSGEWAQGPGLAAAGCGWLYWARWLQRRCCPEWHSPGAGFGRAPGLIKLLLRLRSAENGQQKTVSGAPSASRSTPGRSG